MSRVVRHASALRLFLALVLGLTALLGTISAPAPAAAVTLSGVYGTVNAPEPQRATGSSQRCRMAPS
jgi:hypothetical protein